MAIPKFEPLANSSAGMKKWLKIGLGGLLVILAAAFGLEMTNNDFDLGKLLGGSTPQDAKISRDEKGNILFDKDGNITTEATNGKKADDYNCDDFTTQPKAQAFFAKVGGTNNDLNRLDGDKDGEACESLPKGQ